MRSHINGLNPAMLKEALNKTFIPLWAKDLTAEEMEAYWLVGGVSESTAYRWMGKLGFVFSTIRAGYYVDNHEHPAVVEDRDSYIEKTRALELRQPVWIQMPIETAKRRYPDILTYADKHNVFLFFGGEDSTRISPDAFSAPDMVEFHVDLDPQFFAGFWVPPVLPEPDYLILSSFRFEEGRTTRVARRHCK